MKTVVEGFLWFFTGGDCFLKTHFGNVSKCVLCVFGVLGLFFYFNGCGVCFRVFLCCVGVILFFGVFGLCYFFGVFQSRVILFPSILLRFHIQNPNFFRTPKNNAIVKSNSSREHNKSQTTTKKSKI